MAFSEHCSAFEQGRYSWNSWKEEKVNVVPDLDDDRNLPGTNFIA